MGLGREWWGVIRRGTGGVVWMGSGGESGGDGE